MHWRRGALVCGGIVVSRRLSWEAWRECPCGHWRLASPPKGEVGSHASHQNQTSAHLRSPLRAVPPRPNLGALTLAATGAEAPTNVGAVPLFAVSARIGRRRSREDNTAKIPYYPDIIRYFCRIICFLSRRWWGPLKPLPRSMPRMLRDRCLVSSHGTIAARGRRALCPDNSNASTNPSPHPGGHPLWRSSQRHSERLAGPHSDVLWSRHFRGLGGDGDTKRMRVHRPLTRWPASGLYGHPAGTHGHDSF